MYKVLWIYNKNTHSNPKKEGYITITSSTPEQAVSRLLSEKRGQVDSYGEIIPRAITTTLLKQGKENLEYCVLASFKDKNEAQDFANELRPIPAGWNKLPAGKYPSEVKPITILFPNGDKVVYRSMSYAGKVNKVDKSKISSNCKGRTQSFYDAASGKGPFQAWYATPEEINIYGIC